MATKPDFERYRFPYQQNLFMAFLGGSQLHGAKVKGTDDTDWYGVFIEPPDKMIGLERDEFFVYTTGGNYWRLPRFLEIAVAGIAGGGRLRFERTLASL